MGSSSAEQIVHLGRIVCWTGAWVLLWSAATLPRVRAGCGQSGLCCQGKNNTCRAEGARVSNNDSFTCFCDAGCMDLADCCVDYRRVCNPIDCVLSKEWTDWSDCDVSCGFGSRQRTRQVLVQPANNGRPCQPTVQKLVCEATLCRRISSRKSNQHNNRLDELRESAEIVPAEFSRRSQSNGSLSSQANEMIPENGFANEMDNAGDERMKHKRPTYCSRYELTEAAHPSCQSAMASIVRWSVALSTVSRSSRGEGGGGGGGLTRGVTVCVECSSLAMRTRLGGRCRGHGVHQVETAWTAATIPGCHGSWIMLTKRRPCRCRPEVEPSFVFL